jgi:hypothetical protein
LTKKAEEKPGRTSAAHEKHSPRIPGRLRGRAQILPDGPEHDGAQRLLRARYRQFAAMNIRALPVIAVRIESVITWGDLKTGQPNK